MKGRTPVTLRVAVGRDSSSNVQEKPKRQPKPKKQPNAPKNATSKKSKDAAATNQSAMEVPASTMVSSPVRAKDKRRLKQYEHREDDEDDESYFNPVARPVGQMSLRDSFGVYNNHHSQASDDFEVPLPRGLLRASRTAEKRTYGPPITSDEQMDVLDPLHRAAVEDFLVRAKEICQKIMFDQSLRQQPFSDTELRVIAMKFPMSKTAMRQLLGGDGEMIERHGERILGELRIMKEQYEDMLRSAEEARKSMPQDPNHRHVIDLISDDEETDQLMVQLERDHSGSFERPVADESAYGTNEDNFYDVCSDFGDDDFSDASVATSYTASEQPAHGTDTKQTGIAGRGRGQRRSSGRGRGRGANHWARRSNGSNSGRQSGGGVKKSRGRGSRNSGGANRGRGSSAPARGRGQPAAPGIGMMPM